MKYLDILPLNYIDYLTYTVSPNQEFKLTPGQKVIVPFGKKRIEGIFIQHTKKPKFNTKPIINTENKYILTKNQTEILIYLSKHYFCSPAKALKLMHKIESTKVDEEIMHNNNNKFILIAKETKDPYSQILKRGLSKKGQMLFIFPDTKNLENFLKENKQEISKYKYGIFSSSIKKEEKIKIIENINSKKTKLILGTRVALFLPFRNLKTIIIDHGGSEGHKSEETPRYDSIGISEFISKKNGATVIVQNAIMNMDLYIKSINGYKTINKNQKSKIDTTIIEEPYYPIIGNNLEGKIKNIIKNRKKIAIFVNNKGNNSILMCKDCKNILACNECNNKLTTNSKNVICNFCKKDLKNTLKCNKCNGVNIFSPGINIKKTIEELRKMLPQKIISEISKDSPDLNNLRKADIIVGTTYIKNIDFKNIDSLIVLYPENIINIPGYNSDSKALYFLSLIKEKLGKNKSFYIKTSENENAIIKSLVSGEYLKFYRQKLEELKEYDYPPFKDIIKIEIKDKNNRIFFNSEKKVKEYIKKFTFMSENEHKDKGYFKKILFLKTMKNEVFYDTILKSLKNVTIERNPPKGI